MVKDTVKNLDVSADEYIEAKTPHNEYVTERSYDVNAGS